MGGNPLNFTDPLGLNPVAGVMGGAGIGTAIFPGIGTAIGAGIGAGIGAAGGWYVLGPMLSEESDQASYPNNPENAPDKFRPIKGSGGK